MDNWKEKWKCLKDNAKAKGVSCLLTLSEYIDLAKEAGISRPDQIGKNIDKYQLGRFGDVGNYEIGNCRFITMRQNLEERQLNGGNAAISEKMVGRTKYTSERVFQQSEAIRGRTKLTHNGVLDQSIKVSKKFRLTSPEGVIYEGLNLSEFCRTMGFNQGLLASVCRGSKKSYKGWTGEYAYD